MASWGAFEAEAPEMAARGRELLYRGGQPYGFLATVRKRDGGPRVHPVCPVIAGGRLYVFVVEMSPKFADLLADGRFALHSFPLPEGGEEFYVDGRARHEEDPAVRHVVVEATGGTLGNHGFERLFELDLEHALHVRWANWGTAETWPTYARWGGGG